MHKGENKSTASNYDSTSLVGNLIMTLIKFLEDYGVGVSVVNALSEKLELEINRDGKKYLIQFNNGAAKSPLKSVGKSKELWN